MEEIDIWRSADILIKQHRDKAAEAELIAYVPDWAIPDPPTWKT